MDLSCIIAILPQGEPCDILWRYVLVDLDRLSVMHTAIFNPWHHDTDSAEYGWSPLLQLALHLHYDLDLWVLCLYLCGLCTKIIVIPSVSQNVSPPLPCHLISYIYAHSLAPSPRLYGLHSFIHGNRIHFFSAPSSSAAATTVNVGINVNYNNISSGSENQNCIFFKVKTQYTEPSSTRTTTDRYTPSSEYEDWGRPKRRTAKSNDPIINTSSTQSLKYCFLCR